MFSQEEYSPEDPANPCVHYPTPEYSSYADCDDQFVRRSLPPGLQPFWAVDDIKEATNELSLNLSVVSGYTKDQMSEFIIQYSVLHSHWSRNVEARLSLVESFPSNAGASSLMP